MSPWPTADRARPTNIRAALAAEPHSGPAIATFNRVGLSLTKPYRAVRLLVVRGVQVSQGVSSEMWLGQGGCEGR